MRVKIAVLAPMPSASDRIATIEKTGLRNRPRTARRKSDEVALIEALDAATGWMVYSPGRQRVISAATGVGVSTRMKGMTATTYRSRKHSTSDPKNRYPLAR